MKISIDDPKMEWKWRSAIGDNEEYFHKLLAFFEPIYIIRMGKNLESIKAKSPRESAIKTYEDLGQILNYRISRYAISYYDDGWRWA